MNAILLPIYRLVVSQELEWDYVLWFSSSDFHINGAWLVLL